MAPILKHTTDPVPTDAILIAPEAPPKKLWEETGQSIYVTCSHPAKGGGTTHPTSFPPKFPGPPPSPPKFPPVLFHCGWEPLQLSRSTLTIINVLRTDASLASV
ncbi:hypothetical protein SUGI_1480220 [Cryptomeria japonica]|uniref:Uncharacterized protein n=1 Tax=Cryptomeria japonica TaxID=3369 RepID=A0AAD3NTZ3_CRYJA|nr:hypothetical protein SUGI_1480220 [Cryptomeria japonica]